MITLLYTFILIYTAILLESYTSRKFGESEEMSRSLRDPDQTLLVTSRSLRAHDHTLRGIKICYAKPLHCSMKFAAQSRSNIERKADMISFQLEKSNFTDPYLMAEEIVQQVDAMGIEAVYHNGSGILVITYDDTDGKYITGVRSFHITKTRYVTELKECS